MLDERIYDTGFTNIERRKGEDIAVCSFFYIIIYRIAKT